MRERERPRGHTPIRTEIELLCEFPIAITQTFQFIEPESHWQSEPTHKHKSLYGVLITE